MMAGSTLGWDDSIRPAGSGCHVTCASHASENKRKRRHEDGVPQSLSQLDLHSSPGTKRARVASSSTISIRRRLECADKQQLVDLVASVCQMHPDLFPVVSKLAPALTVERALECLAAYQQRVMTSMPYKGDHQNDYAFLRVQSVLTEFFVALAEYTAAFLPPNCHEPSTALHFLDGATALVHKLPVWHKPVNNYYRNRAYAELGAAWAASINAANLRHPVALAISPWESRLSRHNELSGNRLKAALDQLATNCKETIPVVHATTDVVC